MLLPSSMSLAGGYDMEKPLLWSKAREGGARLRQAGVLHMNSVMHGENDIKDGWRKGDLDPWTLDGSPPRNARNEKSSKWRQGDTSGISLTGGSADSRGSVQKRGAGRRSEPSILPYNDGSQLQAQNMLNEQRCRERHNIEETALGGGTAPLVKAVPLGTAAAKQEELRKDCDQQGTWREQNYWDNRPYAIDGSHVDPITLPGAPGGTDPRRHRSDVTKAGTETFGEYNASAVERMLKLRAERGGEDPNKSNWRLGDDQPFMLDFSTARPHENIHSSHQGEWRAGDARPFALGGEAPPAIRGYGGELLVEQGSAARKHSDVSFDSYPQLGRARRTAPCAQGTEISSTRPIDQVGRSESIHFGPLADALNEMDESRGSRLHVMGLTWAEMGRCGMLTRSASDLVIRATSPQNRSDLYGRNLF